MTAVAKPSPLVATEHTCIELVPVSRTVPVRCEAAVRACVCSNYTGLSWPGSWSSRSRLARGGISRAGPVLSAGVDGRCARPAPRAVHSCDTDWREQGVDYDFKAKK